MNTLTIPAFSAEAAEAAQRRLDNLAKVPRSLGRIEELAVRLAGITGKECPAFPEKSVVLFAADHDIALQGVSATGQEVTEMQVRNFVKGGGTINAFCRNAGARLSVVDVGVKNDLDDVEGLVRRKVMHAARDFSEGPAMTREEALACVQVGIDMAREEAARGVTSRHELIALAIGLGICAVNGVRGLYALAIALLAAYLLLSAAKKRLGGVTGDVFGCLVELTECVVLIVCCV